MGFRERREFWGNWHTCIIYCHMYQIYYLIHIIKNFKWACVELLRERYIFWGAELSLFPRVTRLSLSLFLSHCVHHPAPWLFNVYSQFSFFFYSEITSNMEACHVTMTSMILSDILHLSCRIQQNVNMNVIEWHMPFLKR